MSAGRTAMIAAVTGVIALTVGFVAGAMLAPGTPTTRTVVVEQTAATATPDRSDASDETAPRGRRRAGPDTARAGPDTAPAGPPTTRLAPSRGRAVPPHLTAQQIRRIVAEEIARYHEGDGLPPPPPDPANPELNADPERRAAARESVLLLRRSVLVHDLSYSMGSGKPLVRSDEARLEQFPDERVWSDRPLGFVEKDPARYEILPEDGDGFDPTRTGAAYVFTGIVNRPIATSGGAALVFQRGVGGAGIVTLQGGATVLCRGDFAGKLYLENYATVVIEGDMTGEIVSSSYATILVRGRMSGSFTSKSYANLRVLRGFDGTLDLFDGNNVYFGGYVSQSALEGMTFKGRASLTFESTDLAPGAHTVKPRVVMIVLEPL